MSHKIITIILPSHLKDIANAFAAISPNGHNLFKRQTKCGNYYIVQGPFNMPGLASFFPIKEFKYEYDEEGNVTVVENEIQRGDVETFYAALQAKLSEGESMPGSINDLSQVLEEADCSTQTAMQALTRLGLELKQEEEPEA